MKERLSNVIKAIDAVNTIDPNKEEWQGASWSKELLYSIRMSEMLESFKPDASDNLIIAARAQHIGRWKIARDTYPLGKVGYYNWRNALKAMHAEMTADIMTRYEFGQEDIDQIKLLLQKKGIKKNKETQILEDVICLVFLKYYFQEFAAKHEEEKVIDILKKTWKKMSIDGHDAALQLSYDQHSLGLIKRALNI